MHGRHSLARDQRGFTLTTVFLMLLILGTLGTASVVYTTVDLRSTAHFDTGNRAFLTAEAGLMHGLSTINGPGVINFQQDVVNRWTQRWGSSTTKTVPSDSRLSYQVTVAADPADPANRGTITSTGLAPLSARRQIKLRVAVGGYNGTQGAIYLAADDVTSQFTGNAFDIDGNDHDMSLNPVPGGPVKPGISTRNDTVTNEVARSLNDAQKDNVQGLGFSTSPLTPSVLTTGGPSVDDLDQIVSHLLSLPGMVATNQQDFNGNDVFGTSAAPRVTYLTATDVKLNGHATGAGVLVVDGSITINGTLDFIGWIIVRGATTINANGSDDDETWVLGNATILGSLWTGDLKIKVGGSAIVNYCDQCMRLVDSMNNNNPVVPRPMRIVSWEEVL